MFKQLRVPLDGSGTPMVPLGPRVGSRLARPAAALLSCAALAGCTMVGYPAGPPPAPAGTPAAAEELPDRYGDAGAAVPVDLAALPREPMSRYGNPPSYEVYGRRYHTLDDAEGYDEVGLASWYGAEFEGRPTSSGEVFDPDLLTAAHRTLPLPAWAEVENLDNGRRVIVRVNDRGPFVDPDRRIIDVSEAAARELGMIGAGVARVRVRVLVSPLPVQQDGG